jgi:hypothetical protein
MSLTAHITVEDDQPWLYITAPNPVAGGEPLCIFDAPLNLKDKHTTKLEIDFAHDQTGMPRPDLYDTFRAYQAQQRRAA